MARPVPGGRASGAGKSRKPAARAARRLPEATVALIVHLRRSLRLTGAAIAAKLGLAHSTVSRWLGREGPGRLARLGPPEPVRRYQRERPGELIHLDIKKLGRFDQPGHRITGTRTTGRSRGAGWDFVHVAVDDAPRLAYVEVLDDERRASWSNAVTGLLAPNLMRQSWRPRRLRNDDAGLCAKRPDRAGRVCLPGPEMAQSLARASVSASRAGRHEVGLAHLIDHLHSLREGRINGFAAPRIVGPAPALFSIDADAGVAQHGVIWFSMILPNVRKISGLFSWLSKAAIRQENWAPSRAVWPRKGRSDLRQAMPMP